MTTKQGSDFRETMKRKTAIAVGIATLVFFILMVLDLYHGRPVTGSLVANLGSVVIGFVILVVAFAVQEYYL